jgi:hypothetical protein
MLQNRLVAGVVVTLALFPAAALAGHPQANPAGAGVVNCQYGAGPLERFRLEPRGDGTVAIASVAFPHVYLRLDGAAFFHVG